MKLRVGMPLWRTLARAGVPLYIRVDVHFDRESNSFWADSPDLDGLVVSGQDPEELRSEVESAAGTLVGLELSRTSPRVTADLHIPRAACAA